MGLSNDLTRYVRPNGLPIDTEGLTPERTLLLVINSLVKTTTMSTTKRDFLRSCSDNLPKYKVVDATKSYVDAIMKHFYKLVKGERKK